MRTASTKTPAILLIAAALAAGMIGATPAVALTEDQRLLLGVLPTRAEVRDVTEHKYTHVGTAFFREQPTDLCMKRSLVRPVRYPNPKRGFVKRFEWRSNWKYGPTVQTSAVNDTGSVKKAKRSLKRVKRILKDKDRCFRKLSEPYEVQQRFRDTDLGFRMTIITYIDGRKHRERTTYQRTGSVVVMQSVARWGNSDKKWQRQAKSARRLSKLTSANLKGKG